MADTATPEAPAEKPAAQTEDSKPDEQEEPLVGGDEEETEDESPAVGVPPEGETPDEPKDYELKVPEDSVLDADAAKEILDFSKDQKLSASQAQAVFDRMNEAAKSGQAAIDSQRRQMLADWREKAKTDKEIGGDGFDRSVADANEVVDRWGTPEFKRWLRESGAGNHPELIRLLKRVRAEFDPDAFVTGKPAEGQISKTYAQRIYPNMNPKG